MSHSSSEGANRIRFGVVGRAARSDGQVRFLKIVDDRDDTGGFFVYTTSGDEFVEGTFDYDDWVESFDDLVRLVDSEAGEIEWLDSVEQPSEHEQD